MGRTWHQNEMLWVFISKHDTYDAERKEISYQLKPNPILVAEGY
jgi:hypothetical protein